MERRYRHVVTGAAGFIGSHLVDALLDAGHEVLGIDAFTPDYEPAAKRANISRAIGRPGFNLLPADVNELDLGEIFQAGDRVYHLAAQPGVRPSWGAGFGRYVHDNVEATQHVLEAACSARVARVVFASSSSVYGDAPAPLSEECPAQPISPDGATQVAAEQLGLVYWRTFGLEVIPLRFFTVYGPRQRPDMAFHRFIDAVHASKPVVVYGDGSQCRDFTHVLDVVRILMAVMERGRPGQVVNVGSGSPVSVTEALHLIGLRLGRTPVIQHRPAPPGDVRHTGATTDRLRQLDAPPQIRIAEGIASQVAWQLSTNGGRRHRGNESRASNVVLYSHDTYGLGHLRRNLAIAQAVIRRSPSTKIVMLTGSAVADGWRLPDSVELVRMPTVVKIGPDDYQPAEIRSMSSLRAERAGIIASTLMRVRPQSFLVDHAPLGMKGELSLAFELLKEQLPQTRVVLGLRDILDDPMTVKQSWSSQGIYGVLETVYDEVLVYGCKELYDVTELYGISQAVRERTRFTGYIGKELAMENFAPLVPGWTEPSLGPRVLVMGGGGRDAVQLFHTFIAAWPKIQRDSGARALLIAGPLMAAEDWSELTRVAEGVARLQIVRFSASVLSLIVTADAVVSMSGYNSVVEVLAARRPLIVMPRTAPRSEQLIRARLIEGLGLARVVLPAPEASRGLASAVLDALSTGPAPGSAWAAIDLDGAGRVAEALLQPVASELLCS
jgi:predicted glycosyltransferase/nucleoside-diphosphate-sugar epimerase